MVQFSEKFDSSKIKKWSRHYVDYHGLKKELNRRLVERAKRISAASAAADERSKLLGPGDATPDHGATRHGPTRSALPPAGVGRGAEGDQTPFLGLLMAEIDKVQTFYTKRRDKAVAQLDAQLAFEREKTTPSRRMLPPAGRDVQLQLKAKQILDAPTDALEGSSWDEEAGHGAKAGGSSVSSSIGVAFGSNVAAGSSAADAGASLQMRQPLRSQSGASSGSAPPSGSDSDTESALDYSGSANGSSDWRQRPSRSRLRRWSTNDASPGTSPPPRPRQGKTEEHSARRGFLEVYRTLTLLDNFGMLNYTAIVKLAKKHDQKMARLAGGLAAGGDDASSVSPVGSGVELADLCPPVTPIREKVNAFLSLQGFATRRQLLKEMNRCEEEFAAAFCHGDVAQARGMLLPPKSDEKVDLGQFQLGYRMGMAALLIIWIVWDCIEESGVGERTAIVVSQPAFKAYRAMGGMLLLHWCWGLSVWVWTRTRINYLYLFGMAMRNSRPPLDIFNSAALKTILFSFNLLLYYKTLTGKFPEFFPPGLYPAGMWAYGLLRCFFPWGRRKEMLYTIYRTVGAPWYRVTFLDTYVGDVFTSSVKTLLDSAWSVCFFLSGDFLLSTSEYAARGNAWWESWAMRRVIVPLLCVWPLELRLLQCLRRHCDTHKRVPHLLNALKYIMAAVVALFGVFQAEEPSRGFATDVWVTLYVASSLYSFFWDVQFDWGQEVLTHGRLAKRRMFSRRWCYWAAVWTDLVLRFNWLYSFIPPGLGLTFGLLPATMPLYLTSFVLVVEMLRRTMWGFFRLEHEHLHNTEGYRAATDVVPLHFTTETEAFADMGDRPAMAVVGEVVGVGVAAVLVCIIAVIVAVAEPGGT